MEGVVRWGAKGHNYVIFCRTLRISVLVGCHGGNLKLTFCCGISRWEKSALTQFLFHPPPPPPHHVLCFVLIRRCLADSRALNTIRTDQQSCHNYQPFPTACQTADQKARTRSCDQKIWHFLIQFPFNQIPSHGGTGCRLAVPSEPPSPPPPTPGQTIIIQTDETLVVTGFCSSVMLASDCLWCADPWHYMKSLVQALYWLPVQCCIKWETISLQLGLQSAQCKGSF